MRLWQGVTASVALAAGLVGCEGVITGKEVVRLPLQSTDGGSYAPVKFNLETAMNPVSINFRADFSQTPSEFGKWNTYRATLSKDGTNVATRTINVNHPQSQTQGAGADAPPPGGTVHTLFIADIPANGEYELTITALQNAIVLSSPQIDVRRNVQRPPNYK